MNKFNVCLMVCLLVLTVGAFSMVWAQEAVAPAAAPAAAPAVAPAAAPAGEAVAPGMELQAGAEEGHAQSHGLIAVIWRSGWFGVLIWLLLVSASCTMVALVVDSYVTIRAKKVAQPNLVPLVRAALEQGDVVKVLKHCEDNPGPLSNVLTAGFSNVQEGFEVIQDAISVTADMEGEKMLQRVTYLSVIANTTPMLGLIGTVQGMIFAFGTLGTMQAGAAQQAMLALNISHGLWATAVGLTTAVPSTIFFYLFKNRVATILLNMEALTLDLIKGLRNVEVVTEGE